jgi:hypothetical protein
MSNIFYILLVFLLIGWAVGYYAFRAGGIIHILLALAVIALLLRLIRGKKI